MLAHSLSAPTTLAATGSSELVDKLHSVAATIDDCKWVANALHLSAASGNDIAPHETSKRTEGVSRILFTTLRKASNDILELVEVLESGKGLKS
ncbi:MAG: hypothetical protein LBU76_10890 [Azoarcus sp.]|jgi:hypothetical protein|nr:hypothetical protein [Azoarcus sp.]